MAGCEIHSVFTGLSGNHIKGFNSHGIVAVKNREVCRRDLDRVIDAAKAVAIPTDREVLQILPQDYIIDDQDGIKEPLGMSGCAWRQGPRYQHRYFGTVSRKYLPRRSRIGDMVLMR
jgi:cell division protein FtsA